MNTEFEGRSPVIRGLEAHVGIERDSPQPIRLRRLQEFLRQHVAAESRVHRLIEQVVDVHRDVQPVARRRLRGRRIDGETCGRAHDLNAAAGCHRLLAERERIAEVRRRIPRRYGTRGVAADAFRTIVEDQIAVVVGARANGQRRRRRTGHAKPNGEVPQRPCW